MCRGLPSLCRKLLNAGQVIAKHDSPVIGSLALLPRCSTAAAAPGVDARDYPGPAGHPTLSARRSEALLADFLLFCQAYRRLLLYAQVAGFFGKLIAPSQYLVTCLFSKTTRRAWLGICLVTKIAGGPPAALTGGEFIRMPPMWKGRFGDSISCARWSRLEAAFS